MNNRTKRLLYLIEMVFGGSQTKFARAINRSNAQVNALVRERKPIGDALALNIERTLIEKIEDQVNQITNKTGTNDIHYISVGLMKMAEENILLNKDEDEVDLPFYTDIRLSPRNGFSEDIQNYNNQKLRFSRHILSKNNINPEYAFCLEVEGNSMAPIIPDGAIIGINCEDKILRDDKLYAINHDGLLKIRILRKKTSNKILLQSYNAISYINEEVSLKDINIIGRIFWWSVFL